MLRGPPKYSVSWIDRLNHDSRTICRFRKENLDIIKRVIAEIAKLAREMGMVKLGHLSIHGTKIKASASNFSVLYKKELDEIKNKNHLSEFSYNPQVTVEVEHGIVVAEDVVQNVRDVEQLKPQIEQIEDVFSKLPKNTIISADNDYHRLYRKH